MVLMALRAMTAHILSQICAVVFTSPLTSRLCSQLQELQELPTSPLRMLSSSKKHQLILTLAPGPGVEPGSRGHEADALPLSYRHILEGHLNKRPIRVRRVSIARVGPRPRMAASRLRRCLLG